MQVDRKVACLGRLCCRLWKTVFLNVLQTTKYAFNLVTCSQTFEHFDLVAQRIRSVTLYTRLARRVICNNL